MAENSGIGAAWRTLNIPNYRNYMAGNFVSQIGLWTQRIGVQWLTWELTGSPTWLGIIAFADFFPIVVMGPLGGVMADRLDPLKAVRFYVFLSACLSTGIAGLTLSGQITIESLLVLVLLNGMVMGFNYPVRISIIPALVGRDALTSAIGINSVGGVFRLANRARLNVRLRTERERPPGHLRRCHVSDYNRCRSIPYFLIPASVLKFRAL